MMKERMFFIERTVNEMDFVTLWHWKEIIDFRLEKNSFCPARSLGMYKIQNMVATMNESTLKMWKGVIDGRVVRMLKERNVEIRC